MAAISNLVEASAALHDRTDLSNKELDHLLHEHVSILRQSIASRSLGSVAKDETLLDVSNYSSRPCLVLCWQWANDIVIAF